MENELISRMQLLIKDLGFKSQGEFADAIKVGRSNLSQMMQGKRVIGESIINKISLHLNISTDWLLTGKGKMIKDEKSRQEAILIDNPNIIMVPLVSQYAYAGYLNGFSDMEYIDTLPKIPIIADHNLKGDYLNFEVRGDSMEDGTQDSLVEGDILVCRIVRPEYWKYKLHINKWDFVLVHKSEGILVKRILNHNPETGEITIHSLNPFYKDAVLNLSDISQVFNVVQVLRSRKR